LSVKLESMLQKTSQPLPCLPATWLSTEQTDPVFTKTVRYVTVLSLGIGANTSHFLVCSTSVLLQAFTSKHVLTVRAGGWPFIFQRKNGRLFPNPTATRAVFSVSPLSRPPAPEPGPFEVGLIVHVLQPAVKHHANEMTHYADRPKEARDRGHPRQQLLRCARSCEGLVHRTALLCVPAMTIHAASSIFIRAVGLRAIRDA